MNKKPSWLMYAEQVRKEVDQLKPKKSGKNVEAKLLWSLKTAIDEHKYIPLLPPPPKISPAFAPVASLA